MAFIGWTQDALNMDRVDLHGLFFATDSRTTTVKDVIAPFQMLGRHKLPPHLLTGDSLMALDASRPSQILGTGLTLVEGQLTGGRIGMLHSAGFHLDSVNLRVADFWASVLTLSLEDDAVLFAKLMRGNDAIESGTTDDTLRGGAGKDWINDRGGSDLIDGGTGDDFIYAANGNDTIHGGAGDDYIRHLEFDPEGSYPEASDAPVGSSRIWGGAGDDTLVAGAGRDVLTGGSGADRFVLSLNEGRDIISDFTVGEDLLVLEPFCISSFTELRQVQTAEGLRIGAYGWSAILQGVTEPLTEADVSFAGIALEQRAMKAFFDGWDYA